MTDFKITTNPKILHIMGYSSIKSDNSLFPPKELNAFIEWEQCLEYKKLFQTSKSISSENTIEYQISKKADYPSKYLHDQRKNNFSKNANETKKNKNGMKTIKNQEYEDEKPFYPDNHLPYLVLDISHQQDNNRWVRRKCALCDCRVAVTCLL
jgi:organic radical activating enzyme